MLLHLFENADCFLVITSCSRTEDTRTDILGCAPQHINQSVMRSPPEEHGVRWQPVHSAEGVRKVSGHCCKDAEITAKVDRAPAPQCKSLYSQAKAFWGGLQTSLKPYIAW